MADIQCIQRKNQQKTSSNRRNIGDKESNGDVKILTGSPQIAVSAHAQ